MRGLAHRIVHARMFEYLLVALIIGSAALLGTATSDDLVDRCVAWMGAFWLLTMVVLVLEVLLKMFALWPRVDRYFRDGWNAFDFLAISSLLISIMAVSSVAAYVMFIFLVRLPRLIQGFSTVQELRLILAALIRSIPSVGHIVVLLGIVLYGYAFDGQRNFRRVRPSALGKSRRFRFVAVSNSDAGRLGHDHGHRRRASAAGVGLLRQLCDNQRLYRNRSIHSHRNKKPGRSQAGTSATVGNDYIQGRTSPGTALNPASVPPPGRTLASVPRLVASSSGPGHVHHEVHCGEKAR